MMKKVLRKGRKKEYERQGEVQQKCISQIMKKEQFVDMKEKKHSKKSCKRKKKRKKSIHKSVKNSAKGIY